MDTLDKIHYGNKVLQEICLLNILNEDIFFKYYRVNRKKYLGFIVINGIACIIKESVFDKYYREIFWAFVENVEVCPVEKTITCDLDYISICDKFWQKYIIDTQSKIIDIVKKEKRRLTKNENERARYRRNKNKKKEENIKERFIAFKK